MFYTKSQNCWISKLCVRDINFQILSPFPVGKGGGYEFWWEELKNIYEKASFYFC